MVRTTARDAGQTRDRSPARVEEDAHLGAAAYLLKHDRADALAVTVDELSTEPIGIITRADLVEATAEGLDVNDARVRDVMEPVVSTGRPDTARREVPWT